VYQYRSILVLELRVFNAVCHPYCKEKPSIDIRLDTASYVVVGRASSAEEPFWAETPYRVEKYMKFFIDRIIVVPQLQPRH
jgi:hypothetical protein